ncbi:MAG TPA: hypothetical protein VF060_23570 [Trebonia sp.]
MGQSRSGLPDGIAAVDLAVMQRVEHSDSRLLDLVMPRLSRLADHGVLWTGLAFALWATGDRWPRRAAWRGIGSLLAASAVANIAGKGLTARGRPEIRVPPARRLPRTPRRCRSRPAMPPPRPRSQPESHRRSPASRCPSSCSPPRWARPGSSPACTIRPTSSPGSPSAPPPVR